MLIHQLEQRDQRLPTQLSERDAISRTEERREKQGDPARARVKIESHGVVLEPFFPSNSDDAQPRGTPTAHDRFTADQLTKFHGALDCFYGGPDTTRRWPGQGTPAFR